MSTFFQKPAGTTGAFGTPQNGNTGASLSAFSTPQSKPGPFSLSAFGGQQQQQPGTTNAFGSPAPQQQNASTLGGFAGFGSSTNQNTGGGFGQQQQQQTGAFGTPSTGGFGQSSGGGFGLGQNPNQGQTGAFGQSSGAFGQSAGGSTFGSMFPQKAGPFGGFIGTQNQQQQQPNQGTFGGFASQQPQQPGFGGSTFGGGFGGGSNFGGGQSTFAGGALNQSSWLGPQQQQQQSQQIQQQSNITPITRWSDLPPNDQKFLEDLEKYITEQKQIAEDLKTRSPQLEEYVSSIPTDVAEVQKRFDSISHILSVDTTILQNDLKVKFDKLSTQTQQTIRLLEVLTHPSASSLSYLASTHGAGGDSLIDFFLQKTIEWQVRLEGFKHEIQEIDRMLKTVEEGQMAGYASASDEILETLRAQWEGFCGLAARVGKLRERAAEVKLAAERGLRGRL